MGPEMDGAGEGEALYPAADRFTVRWPKLCHADGVKGTSRLVYFNHGE